MKVISGLIFSACVLLVPWTAGAASIDYTVQVVGVLGPGGDPIHRITYSFNGFDLEPFEEIEIRFSPLQFTSIFNPIGGDVDISVVTYQVNNPPGAAGTFSLVALIDNPSFDRPFAVDAILSGDVPDTLPFALNRLQPGTFAFVEQLSSGSAHHVPEPASFGGVALAVSVAVLRLSRSGRSSI